MVPKGRGDGNDDGEPRTAQAAPRSNKPYVVEAPIMISEARVVLVTATIATETPC